MRLLLLGMPLLALVGCDEGPKTPEQAAAEMASAPKMLPGRWRTSFEFTGMEMPGAPPEAQAMMKNMMRGRTDESCVTAEEANRDPRDFLRRSQQQGGCTFDRFDVSDSGLIDAAMVCAPQEGARVEATMKGSIQPERIDMTIDSNTTNAAMPEGNARVTMKMNSVRLGDCA